jgi:hypothetical protein
MHNMIQIYNYATQWVDKEKNSKQYFCTFYNKGSFNVPPSEQCNKFNAMQHTHTHTHTMLLVENLQRELLAKLPFSPQAHVVTSL